jgi:hypothetical protein
MLFRTLLPLTATLLFLTGCSTFDRREMTFMERRGVSPQVLTKLDRGRPLTPSDAIEMTSRGVPDQFILRQLYSEGLDQVITRTDALRMRKAGVRAVVIDAFFRESDHFARGYAERHAVHYYGTGFEDPWVPGYYDGWGLGVGVATF